MPRGSKDKYTDKQKRQAEHIEESYEDRGMPKRVAEKRAWQTVNKQSGGRRTIWRRTRDKPQGQTSRSQGIRTTCRPLPQGRLFPSAKKSDEAQGFQIAK